MSSGLWVRLHVLLAKAKSMDRIAKALREVTQKGPRLPHFDGGLPDDIIYAFLQYCYEGCYTHGKERYQFAVWSKLDPAGPEFQRGQRDWTLADSPCTEDPHRRTVQMPAFLRCMQGHSLVGAVDERVGVSLSLNNI